MEEKDKNIDESWKEAVEKEKTKTEAEGKFSPGEADFTFFITTLSLQTAIALGEIENPITNRKEENLTQARFIIDTIDMLKNKTKGNLTPQESALLENILYELRTKYIAKAKI